MHAHVAILDVGSGEATDLPDRLGRTRSGQERSGPESARRRAPGFASTEPPAIAGMWCLRCRTAGQANA
jgi:hypothetical protein